MTENKKARLMIVTGPVAPYRLDLYRSVAHELSGEFETSLSYGRRDQKDHAWEGLFDDFGDECAVEYRPGIELPRFIAATIRKLKLGRGRALLPSIRLIGDVLRRKPRILWVSEITTYTILPLLIGRLRGARIVLSTELGRHTPREGCSRVIKMLHRWPGLHVSLVIANTPHAQTPVLRRLGKKVVFAPHAVHVGAAPEREEHDGPVVFLFTGSLVPRKGIDHLIAAAAELRDRGDDNFEVQLAGGGDEAWVRGLLEKSAVAGKLRLLGFREGAALRELYLRADAYILPSRFDTYAVVVHEACAAGLPVIVSRHAGAAKTLVENKESGFVVDPADAKSMADAMEKLIKDPAARREMGAAARRVAEEYDVDRMAGRVASALGKLAA